MNRIDNDSLLHAMKWRYAVKKFDAAKKISDADWNVLAESVRLAPSSYGLQPWKFLLIENQKLRKELRAVSWNQSQVEEASHFLVFTTVTKLTEQNIENHISQVAKVRGSSTASLQGYRDMMVSDLVRGPRSETIKWWAQRQSYIAMGQLMYTAALMQIDTCPMEGLDAAAYDNILKLESSGYSTVAAVALGYRHADDGYQRQPKVRFELKDVLSVIK